MRLNMVVKAQNEQNKVPEIKGFSQIFQEKEEIVDVTSGEESIGITSEELCLNKTSREPTLD